MLIVDQNGWLRLPQSLRDEAGVGDRVRAAASLGRIELNAEDPGQPTAEPLERSARPSPPQTRHRTEATLDAVSKSYGADRVFSDLSWTFATGQLHVIAGASGSGKTTLINILAGLEKPDDGRVWIAGDRIDDLTGDAGAAWRRRMVGYVSQHSTLIDFLSVAENVTLALTLRGYNEREAASRTEEALDWVGLAELAPRRAGRLSGGEQRRVALARALAPDPRLLIADEPTAHLDRMSGRLVIRLLTKTAEERGTTIIAAGHDPDLIKAAHAGISLGSDGPSTLAPPA